MEIERIAVWAECRFGLEGGYDIENVDMFGRWRELDVAVWLAENEDWR